MIRTLSLTVVLLMYFATGTVGVPFAQIGDSSCVDSGEISPISSSVQIHAVLQGEYVHIGSRSVTGLVLHQIFEKARHPWYFKMSIV